MSEPEDGFFAFEAMAHPARRQILRLLADGPMSSGDIAVAVDYIGRTAISNHLKILKTSGLIRETRKGRYRYYSVDPSAAQDVVGFVMDVYRSSFVELQRVAELNESNADEARQRRKG